ncbi:ATP-binding protein [Streptomyces sp. H10-C2]|uniref:ATP-binding protein n=1 Tax=unclassified Streptomyces TaxID=2593676 RepID=UPI0024BA32D6|nr:MULTISPECIES: ATP-binding protein [unclassified Streptomyces]MDJ0346959.1 ATP-binding protein [Streptomyces sp. PH10-H1]MDJ0374624.1 ATP-binding protein [Streptomyces sp. H10-C2]
MSAAATKRKSVSRFGRVLGLGAERFMPAPQLVALADGLVVTTTGAEAWFTLSAANTDLMPEDVQDLEQDAAALALAKILPGYACHLKVIWSQIDGEVYRAEAQQMFTAGDVEAFAAMWAARLDQLDLPQRHLLLGVKIGERSSAVSATVKNAAGHALGLKHTGLAENELAELDGAVRRLERRLEATPWRARIAPVELLAWAVSRESYRPQPAPPTLPTVTGASLVRLSQGRAVPHADHVQMLDARGETAAWVSLLAMPTFPEQLYTPGEQEWLRCLSEIRYTHASGEEVLVCPEASVRFEVWRKGAAIKEVDRVRKSAKEQRRSAAEGSAGEVLAETEETEAVMEGLRQRMSRDSTTLLQDHPRLLVASTESLEDLRARCDAVVSHYMGLSIDVLVAVDEQRELWLESQVGDMLRVADLGHTRETSALAASMFWGGCEAGDEAGPIAGLLTGTTSGVCRFDIAAGSARGDATTTAFLGRSGRGKTTSMMSATLTAAMRGAFSLMLGFKGDEGALIKAGEYLGLPSHHVTCGGDTPGVADLFRMLPHGEAALQVVSQMLIMLPDHMRTQGVETHLLRAANEVAAGPDPASWRVVDYLKGDGHDLARNAGQALAELARTQLGAPVLGQPAAGASPLRPEPGLWLVQVPGLTMPQAGTVPADMTMNERVSLALMRGLIAYALNTAARTDLRYLPKVIAVPEVHVLTGTDDGRKFLDLIARMGRALDTSLAIDSQDPNSLLGLDGVLEAITTVFGFEQATKLQQDALSELLRLPVGPASRALISGISKGDRKKIRHGHCIVRDRYDRVATMQWDIPSAELKQALSTNPKDQTQDDEPDENNVVGDELDPESAGSDPQAGSTKAGSEAA